MEYYTYKKDLFAIDEEKKLTMRYDDVEAEWDLSSVEKNTLRKSGELISAENAMKITAGNPPYQFEDEFLNSMSLFEK